MLAGADSALHQACNDVVDAGVDLRVGQYAVLEQEHLAVAAPVGVLGHQLAQRDTRTGLDLPESKQPGYGTHRLLRDCEGRPLYGTSHLEQITRRTGTRIGDRADAVRDPGQQSDPGALPLDRRLHRFDLLGFGSEPFLPVDPRRGCRPRA